MNKPRLKHHGDADDDFDLTKMKDVADYLEELVAEDDDEYLKRVCADARADLDRSIGKFLEGEGDKDGED